MGRPVRMARPGRSNYLCQARLALHLERQGELRPRCRPVARADHRLVARHAQWRSSRAAGAADAHPLAAHISSTRENCLGSRCAHYSDCHVLQARRTALEADIVVVNHHLLLADLALKEDGFGDLLPSVDAVILDEAHQSP